MQYQEGSDGLEEFAGKVVMYDAAVGFVVSGNDRMNTLEVLPFLLTGNRRIDRVPITLEIFEEDRFFFLELEEALTVFEGFFNHAGIPLEKVRETFKKTSHERGLRGITSGTM